MPGILGVVLAGGLARRMGGADKPLQPLGGEPVLAHIIRRFRPQVDDLILNANGDPARFADFALPVAADPLPDFAGPLAGVLAGLGWLRQHRPDLDAVITVPGDGPFLPRDLVARLLAASRGNGGGLACVASDGRANPVVGLWPVALHDDLRRAVIEEGVRKVDVWTARHGVAVADYAGQPVDPFFNANRREDMAEAETLLARLRGLEREGI